MTKYSPGCICDCSAQSADELNRRTIVEAIYCGFKFEWPDENNEEYSQILSEGADSAIDFLNDSEYCPKDHSFFFEENCLFLAPNEDFDEGDEE